MPIERFGSDGRFIESVGTQGHLPEQYQSPTALDFDASGNLFIADSDNSRIDVFSPVPEPNVLVVAGFAGFLLILFRRARAPFKARFEP